MEEKFDDLDGLFESENGREWLTEAGVEYFTRAICNRLDNSGTEVCLLANAENEISSWVEDRDVQSGYDSCHLYRLAVARLGRQAIDYIYHCFLRGRINALIEEHKKTGYCLNLTCQN